MFHDVHNNYCMLNGKKIAILKWYTINRSYWSPFLKGILYMSRIFKTKVFSKHYWRIYFYACKSLFRYTCLIFGTNNIPIHRRGNHYVGKLDYKCVYLVPAFEQTSWDDVLLRWMDRIISLALRMTCPFG